MKKYLFLFISITILSASCKHKADKGTTTKTKVVIKDSTTFIVKKSVLTYKNPLLIQYNKFVDSLDSTNMETSTLAAARYGFLFKGLDANTCDTAFTIFNDYYKRLAENLEQQLAKKYATNLDQYYAYDDEHTKKPIPDSVLNYVNGLNKNGFKIDIEEGDVYIAQDRDFVAKWFYQFVSPAMKEFLVQMNKENKQTFMEDASLMITSTALVDRSIWWEKFCDNHHNFIWYDEGLGYEKEYIQLLLTGCDNDPIMDDEGKKVSDYFNGAYVYLNRNYPLTYTGKIVIPYYQLLLDGKKTKADALLEDYKKRGIISD